VSALSQLLAEDRDPAAETAKRWDPALRAERTVCWDELRRHVAALCERLDGGAASEADSRTWVLLTEDAYAFAVGLLALWHTGRHAISPPNHQLESLRQLETRGAGVLSDRPDWFPEGSCLNPVIETAGPCTARFEELDPEATALELYTSGTTGNEKPISKRIRHLSDEVAELGAAWDDTLGNATVYATASHQHVYGLLFGVLWPLSSGRPFMAHHFQQPGELVPRMREVGDCVLASVPTHLKRLARHTGLPTLRGVCRTIFSSGGPLATETANDIAGLLGAAPIEVLGSTETGGIGWRQQDSAGGQAGVSVHWEPFRRVRVTRDPDTEVLRVASPFVSVDTGGKGFATGDRVTFRSDGRFELAGRADRVVKVGEKRVNLDRMESQLRGHAWVQEVALTLVDRDTDLRVAAAVVPSEEGMEQIRERGRSGLGRGLRASLAGFWDPVVQPRLWRVVPALPANEQGKLTRSALDELFREASYGEASMDRPEVLEELRGSDFLERACRVPHDLACLPGHFPDQPIVPGVLQLDWVMELAAQLLERVVEVRELRAIKLLAPLRPGDSFRIHVRATAAGEIAFSVFSEDHEHAKGRVRLNAGEETR
jgi:acyl-coenzyme A synthetase/AMP-(fatty) acid ligase/3-hydroxymyristoyl/3-hydroxydecanoyl-(acyl carrier protein) dehydratase